MIRKVGLFIVVLVLLAGSSAQNAQARPSYQSSPAQARICYTNLTCASPTPTTTDSSDLNHYIEQVLANEWHSLAGLEALKAGAIAIRTFAYRELGCGAYTGKNLTEPGTTPPIISRVVLGVDQLVQMQVQIQNTGDVTWAAEGADRVQLSYRWYDSQGATVLWDGERTNLSANVPPGGVITLQAQLRAPAQPGVYTLKWDMLRGTHAGQVARQTQVTLPA